MPEETQRKCPHSIVVVKEKDVLHMQRRKVNGLSIQIHLLYSALEQSGIFLGTNSTPIPFIVLHCD